MQGLEIWLCSKLEQNSNISKCSMRKIVREKQSNPCSQNYFTLSKLKCSVFTLNTSYFLYNASNLMQNKIPHAKLSSPTTLENGSIQE